MSRRFEELDWRRTRLGEISLRRRLDPLLKVDVYEVKLDDEFLMSSLFTAAEIELARLGLARLAEGTNRSGDPGATDGDPDMADRGLDVAVGGLGLGYTAQAVLEQPRVRSLVVIEALDAVIEWHQRSLLPDASGLASDPRTRFVAGDFFALAGADTGLDPEQPGRRLHAILLDIDHSPRHVLDPSHTAFYQPDGLRRLARHLHPGGVFGLWSNDPPDDTFTAALRKVFGAADARVVTFPNPLQGREAANTVYLATLEPSSQPLPD